MGTLRRLLLLITAATLVFLSSSVQQVESLGTFQLLLRTFSNLEGRDSTGGCCSGQQSADGSCRGACSVSFRICIQHYQATVDPKQPCIFGEFFTQVLDNSSTLRLHETNFSDPIDFDFNFTWPKTFSMIIEAWHNYGNRGGNRMLVSRFIAQRSLEVYPDWTSDILTTNHSLLEISYRVQCKVNYYGENCATLCKPRDDKFGHYTCRSDGKRACMPGWRGEYCQIAMCILGCHETHGFCNQPNECKCRPGWEGSFCDTCTRYPGCIHGTCFKPWQCNCNEGWGGLFCDQDLNYCTNHKPCKNGGTCTNTGHGSYTCSCADDYMGKNCDSLRNPCAENPCQNGGSCENPDEGEFVCQCSPGFFGPRCETSASICTDNPCDNGGTCVHDPGGFICACPNGFYGDHCEKSKPSCEDDFCLNGGTCIDDLGGPVCRCLNSFTGERCENNINCVDNPCLNGGSCYTYENSFRCACSSGFAGPLCQVTSNRCSLRPCANGGTCHDLINDYSCDCAFGFHGKNCSVHSVSCSNSPCKNNAVCLEKPNGYLCHCTNGYYGSNCEFHILQSSVHLPKKPLHGDSSTAHSTAISNVSHQVSDDDEERLSGSQVALIATVSTILPILAVLVVAVVLALRRCRQKHQNVPKDFEEKDDDEQLQNERNSMHMNNKCVHHTKIVNTLDRMPAKVTNEVPAKVLNTDVGSNKLSENKNLVCVQRTLDRKDHSSDYSDNGHQSIHEWSPNSGVYVIEDHFRSPPSLDTEADVFATEV